jgi:uncharacterized protein YhdP
MHKKKLTTIYFLWHLLHIFYILLCLLVLAKLTTPAINKYYFTKESFITRAADKLHVEDVSLQWRGLAPSLVLHDISLAKVPNDQIESISKIFAVIDLWKSLFYLNLNLSNIVVNDITFNVAGVEHDMPKIQEINDLQQLLKTIHYQKLNVHLENIRVKNLTIKYHNASHIIKASNVKYTSLGSIDNLKFNIYALDNESVDVSTTLSSYKDRLGNVIRASYNLRSNGKYPDYIAAAIQTKLKLQRLSGGLVAHYTWHKNADPIVEVFHDLEFEAEQNDEKLIEFNNFKGHLLITLNSYNNYSIKGAIDKVSFNNYVLQGLNYDFKSDLDNGDEFRLQNLDLAAIKSLSSLSAVNKDMALWFKEATLGGLVKDLYLSGYNFTTNPMIKVTRANVAGLKFAPWHHYPGMESLDIKLKYLDGVGDAIVHSSNQNGYISIDVPAIFKNKLRLKSQGSYVTFSKKSDSIWQILVPHAVWGYNGNDISSDIAINAGGIENTNFTGHFNAKNMNVLSLQELLAAQPLNAKLRKWLQSSITAGVLADASLDIDISDTNKFRFKGEFDKANLKFADSWPQLENIKGKIYLDNNKLELVSSKASMKTQDFDSININILDVHKPNIVVAINSQVDLAKAKGIIDSSPLHKTLGKYFSGADIAGNSQLQLGFKLNHAMGFALADVVGEVLLNQSSISWPKLSFSLTNTKGKLSFHDFELSSHNLEALYHKDKVNLIATSGSNGLRIDMKGFLDARAMAGEYLPFEIAKNISGKADFGAVLDILPGHDLVGKLNISTNALGINIDYPPPLSKQKNLQRPLVFKANFTAKEANYNLSIAPNIKFIAKSSSIKPIDSMNIYVDNLNIDSWTKCFNQDSKLNITNLNIFAKKLIFKKEIFKNMSVSMVKKNEKFIISADSKKIKGDFIYLANNKLKIDLDYLYLSKHFASGFGRANEDGYTYDVVIKKLLFSGYNIENIKAVLNGENKNEHKIKQLRFSYKNSDFDMKGVLDTGSSPKSRLEGRVSSADFSEIFSYLPSLHNFNKGSGDIEFYIAWPDTLSKFTPKLSSAMFDVKIVDGIIIDIGEQASKDLEASKAVNFLSMKNIIQQLSSNNERDESYAFDEIQGNLIYSKGVLNTDKIAMKGDFGSAYIKGDINFKSYSYDLYMTVMPIITSSIPTIAALAGGVFTGFIAWAASQIVENQISKIAMKVYKISGSVKSPKIVELDHDNLPAEAVIL